MTAIAQRRVAGATALMILLYLLQVALFAPAANADHASAFTSGSPTNECGWEGSGSIPSSLYKKYQFSGSFSSPEGSADVTVELSGGGFTYTNNEATLQIYRIILKVGQGVGTDVVLGDHNVAQSGELAIPNGLSHVTFCLTDAEEPEEPESPTFVVGACDETTGLRPVTFTVDADSEVGIDGVVASPEDNAFQPGDHEIDLPEGAYTWHLFSPIDSGTQIDQGNFTVGECDVPPETFGGDLTVEKVVVISSGTPSTTSFDFTVTDEAPFSLVHGDSESFSYTFESAEGSVTVTITEGAITETGWTTSISCTDESTGSSSVEVTVGDGDDITCTVTNTFRDDTTTTSPPPPPPPPPPPGPESTSVNFDAFCDDDGNFVGAFSLPNASGSLDINGDGVFGAGETGLASGTYILTGATYMWSATADAGFVLSGAASGSGETESCEAEVLGTTITAPPEVTAETLPFTGFESGDTVKLGLLALLAGALMLFAARGTKEEEAAATDIGGWSSL